MTDRFPPVHRPRPRRPQVAAAATVTALAAVALVVLQPGGATAESSGSTTGHVVQPGDTVRSIAALHGVDPEDVRAANGIVDDRLYAGARLVIDGGAARPATASSDGGTHVVERGDVLIHIARDHGVALEELLAVNDLSMTTIIVPGDRIEIPSGSDPGSVPSSPSPRVVCPVPGAGFMNDWGFPRGGDRFHEGTDLFAPAGTPIVAPVTGQLRFGRNDLGGRTFTISTPSGWEAYGAHLSEQIGSSRWVAAGEVIGSVGDSGNAKGGDPHLHLQLERGGRPANPYPSLIAAC